MRILVVNCGSSTLKFQLIDSETEEVIASGLCERIGLDGSITYKAHGEKHEEKTDLSDHGVAIKPRSSALAMACLENATGKLLSPSGAALCSSRRSIVPNWPPASLRLTGWICSTFSIP